MGLARPKGVERVEVVTLIKTTVVVGEGTEEDLLRYLDQYWTPEGDLVATVDPVEKEKEV